MTRRHLTAAEIAEAALPGLPASERGIRGIATRENWPSRPRKGKGGGVEYPISALPHAARDALLSRAVTTVPAPVAPAITDPGQLAGWQRRALEARAIILSHIETAALTGGGILAAEAAFAQAATAGTLPPALAEAVATANQRQGASRAISAVTLRRWRSEAQRAGGQAVALAPRQAPIRLDQPWLPRLLELYARPTKPSIAWCIEQMARDGVEVPPLRTAQAAIGRLGALAKSQGRIGPRELKRFRAFVKRNFDELEPLDVISADGHKFKAEVAHPIHGKPVRPELVTVIDIATRRVIGWSAGLAEGAWLVADALRAAAEQAGVAAIFYTDNGPGFVNEHLGAQGLGVLARLGTTHQTAIAYNAQARGVIERLQASLWGVAAKTLPAYLGRDMDREARQAVHKRSRRDLAQAGQSRLIMPWADFLIFAQAQIDQYNARPHSGLPKMRDTEGRLRHEAPVDAWARHVAAGWSPISVTAEESADLFRPYEIRKVSRATVSLFGTSYGHRVLETLDLHGQEVMVGYDIHNPSRVWVRDLDERLLCIAERDAFDAAYMPKSQVELARERRAQGRERRLETHLAEVREELTGGLPLIEASIITPMTIEQEALAAEALAALAPVVVPLRSAAERPVFADDLSWIEWLLVNPAAVTPADRAQLRDALRQPEFRLLMEVSGVDRQALAGLASNVVRQIA